MRPLRRRADASIEGKWSAKILSGANAGYIDLEVQRAGYSKISPDQLVAMRIHGVDTDFVKEVRAHGFKDPSIDNLMELRIHELRHRDLPWTAFFAL